MSQFSFGHIVRFDRRLKSELRFWQNFFIGEKITYANKEYKFAAFGFSGVTVNRTGDGLEAALVFPNNELTRRFAVKAVDDSYLVEVDVLIIENPDPDSGLANNHTVAHSYVGQVTGGQWDEVSLNLELSSVLDAVGTDVPRRSLTQKLVGNLPTSSNVRLQ